jgi:2'-5' RNA ligase
MTHARLAKRRDDFAVLVTGEIRATLRAVASDVKQPVTLDDLAVIPTRWRVRVDAHLMRHVKAVYWEAVDNVAAPVVKAITGKTLVSAALPLPLTPPPNEANWAELADDGYTISRVSDTVAEAYLSEARNRLVNVGNTIWETVRGNLLDGMQAGEGVQALSQRIADSTPLAQPRAEVIARTEVNQAANFGQLAQAQSLDTGGTKTWLATNDERTREDHADADGQTVAMDEQFDVGGESLDCPGDGSAEQSINCRCTMEFSIDAGTAENTDESAMIDEEENLQAAATPGAMQTGAMIALVPSESEIKRLALDGGEPPEQLHLTLLFLGDAAGYPPPARQSLAVNLASIFEQDLPIEARAFGVALWNPDGGSPCWVLNIGDSLDTPGELAETGEFVNQAASAAGVQALIPPQHSPWSPHICMAYTADPSLLTELIDRLGTVTFDRVRLAFADETTDIQLGAATAPADEGNTP